MILKPSLSHDEARKIIYHIENLAETDEDKPVAISVFNAFDQQIGFLAMDGTLPISIDYIATNKAHSALAFSRDTIEWSDSKGKTRPAHFNLNTTDPKFTTFPGGVIIIVDDEIVGSIGVSGRHGTQKFDESLKNFQDHELANAGRKYFFDTFIK